MYTDSFLYFFLYYYFLLYFLSVSVCLKFHKGILSALSCFLYFFSAFLPRTGLKVYKGIF